MMPVFVVMCVVGCVLHHWASGALNADELAVTYHHRMTHHQIHRTDQKQIILHCVAETFAYAIAYAIAYASLRQAYADRRPSHHMLISCVLPTPAKPEHCAITPSRHCLLGPDGLNA